MVVIFSTPPRKYIFCLFICFQSLTPSEEVPDPASIIRWHPFFPLEDVPDIEAAPLPQPPHQEKLGTAASVLGEIGTSILCGISYVC